MKKDTIYNLMSVVAGIGGPFLAVYFFRKALKAAEEVRTDGVGGEETSAV